MLMLPAKSSASEPDTTIFVSPNAVSPAATANGTTIPSEMAIVPSFMLAGLGLNRRRRRKKGTALGEAEARVVEVFLSGLLFCASASTLLAVTIGFPSEPMVLILRYGCDERTAVSEC